MVDQGAAFRLLFAFDDLLTDMFATYRENLSVAGNSGT